MVSLPSSHSLTSSSSTRYGHHQRGAMPHDGLKLLLLKSSTSPVWRQVATGTGEHMRTSLSTSDLDRAWSRKERRRHRTLATISGGSYRQQHHPSRHSTPEENRIARLPHRRSAMSFCPSSFVNDALTRWKISCFSALCNGCRGGKSRRFLKYHIRKTSEVRLARGIRLVTTSSCTNTPPEDIL